ncbi:MAG: DUF4340 domain-containing protein [Puniceicoccales bacterium]|nr:DUF4340 domain-containing protein [Puniceicoccales bacterium]
MLRFGFTLLLLLLNLFWVVFYFYVKTHSKSTNDVPHLQVQSKLLNVQSIEIAHLDTGNTYKLKKSATSWQLESPFRWAANNLAVESFIQQLDNLDTKLNFKACHLQTEKNLLDQYGLNPPWVSVKIASDQRVYTLHIGQKIKSNNCLYVYEPETQMIFISTPEAFDTLFFELDKWCSAYIFQGSLNNLQSISYDTPTQHVFLSQEKEQWWLKNPVNAKASNMHVETVIHQIKNLEVFRFLDAKEIASFIPQLNSPAHVRTLTISDDTRTYILKFLPYNDDKNIFVAQGDNYDRLFLFKSTWVSRLDNPQETLRERQIFTFPIASVDKVIYTHANDQIELHQIEGQRWEALHYQNQVLVNTDRASYGAIYTFLKQLKTVYIESFLDATFSSLSLPCEDLIQVKLSLPQGQVQCTLYDVQGNFYLKLKDDPTLFKITLLDPDCFNRSFDDFQNKQIWQWNQDERLYTLSWLSSTKKLTNGSLLFALKSLDFEHPKIAKPIESLLRGLNAKKFVRLNEYTIPYFAFGSTMNYLWPHRLHIQTIDAENIVRTYILYVADRLGGDLQFAKYQGKIFALHQSWIDAIFTLTELPTWEHKALKFSVYGETR